MQTEVNAGRAGNCLTVAHLMRGQDALVIMQQSLGIQCTDSQVLMRALWQQIRVPCCDVKHAPMLAQDAPGLLVSALLASEQ